VSYLQSCVEFLNLAIAGNDAGKLVEALEELENQVPCRFSSSHANPPCPALLWCAPGCFFGDGWCAPGCFFGDGSCPGP